MSTPASEYRVSFMNGMRVAKMGRPLVAAHGSAKLAQFMIGVKPERGGAVEMAISNW